MELYRIFIGGLDLKVTKDDIKEALFPLSPKNLHTKKSNSSKHTRKGNKKNKKMFAFFEVKSLETARRLTQQPLLIRDNEYYCQLSHKSLKNHSNCMSSRVYLKDIPLQLTDSRLIQFLEQFGEIDGAYSIKDAQGNSKGYGFADFKNEISAIKLAE